MVLWDAAVCRCVGDAVPFPLPLSVPRHICGAWCCSELAKDALWGRTETGTGTRMGTGPGMGTGIRTGMRKGMGM